MRVVNDDGSHIPEHQILGVNELFPLLAWGGVYMIEDIETSYWESNGLYGYDTRYGFLHKNNFIEASKLLCDAVNQEFLNPNSRVLVSEKASFSEEVLSTISSVTFGQNMVILQKKTEEELVS